jgi:hypothetical protein
MEMKRSNQPRRPIFDAAVILPFGEDKIALEIAQRAASQQWCDRRLTHS